MGRITDAIKHLIIVNVIFFVAGIAGYGGILYKYLALWFPENQNFGIWQLVSHMFLHDFSGFLHILFNMYALWAFGSPLERIWGRNKFLFFYFSAGIGAALVHTAANYYFFTQGFTEVVNIPAVGASGAVYGVLVAFAFMYPNAQLMMIFLPIPIKAKYFVPLIIVGDLFFGFSNANTGIAHFAHIGGALIGFIMMWYWKRNQFNQNRWDS
ncbi:rhomboid family intramembrane serine protease [Croceivirga thetidis]|uniref:Rhomboid family intramembrane serine protease n=1 Tax=Croceivirga thetidis TaxID=2721623 RepID=A0ABX1GSA1_9FLAO|nr:rhomboid family intramembrane serine protease [Croceivirga thetidis]NKI32822.1 rhomboid family intramembrane serine protease [Croceivirga thetidis]